MEIKVDRPSGIMEIKQIIDGVGYKRKFFGYSEKEAVKRFKDYIKEKR